jgi:carboxyl-terminal processing protease
VVIEEHEFGVRVAEVVPLTPAWDAGLESGDVIVEVDGTPAGLLSLSDFQAVMTGPEGTEVDFVVEYEADTGFVEEEVTAARAFLDPPRRY